MVSNLNPQPCVTSAYLFAVHYQHFSDVSCDVIRRWSQKRRRLGRHARGDSALSLHGIKGFDGPKGNSVLIASSVGGYEGSAKVYDDRFTVSHFNFLLKNITKKLPLVDDILQKSRNRSLRVFMGFRICTYRKLTRHFLDRTKNKYRKFIRKCTEN